MMPGASVEPDSVTGDTYKRAEITVLRQARLYVLIIECDKRE